MQIRKIGSLVFGILQIVTASLMIILSLIFHFNNVNRASVIENPHEISVQLVILTGIGGCLLVNGLFLAFQWQKEKMR